MEQNNAIWTSLLKTVLDMPGIRVDRDEFLKDKLEKFCPSDKLELAVENPVKMVPKNILDKIANTSINRHTTKVTSLSAATGIIADTALDNSVNAIALGVTGISNNGVPIEMAKFYWHALTLSQKLAYLYGFPDLSKLDKESLSNLFTVCAGVMSGDDIAGTALNDISKHFAETTAEYPINTTSYPVIQQIKERLDTYLTSQESLDLGIDKISSTVSSVAKSKTGETTDTKPIKKKKKNKGFVSSLICSASAFVNIKGSIQDCISTFATFRPCAKRLQNRLAEAMNNFGQYQYECDYCEKDQAGQYRTISPEEMAIMMLINAAKADKAITKEEKKYIDREIRNSSLSNDAQEALEASFNTEELFDIDYSVFEDNISLLEDTLHKIKEIIESDGKISMVEKMHLRKIEKELC